MLNKKVLVTGSSSFTGHYVINELELNGYTVIEQSGEPVDLRCFDSVKNLVNSVKPNYVIHLAAMSFVGHENINEIYETNLLGTINLLRALEEADIVLQKVVLASSANIYGNIPVENISEDQSANPANHYGISKFSMEMAAKQWIGKLPIVITRPFNYTGVGQAGHFLVPKIVSHFQQRKTEIELGNIDVYRDFSDVRDIAKWYVAILDSDKVDFTVNFCSGKLVSLAEIINQLNDIAKYCIKVKVNPEFVRDNEIKKLCGDNNLLISLVGEKSRKSMRDTLLWMYENN